MPSAFLKMLDSDDGQTVIRCGPYCAQKRAKKQQVVGVSPSRVFPSFASSIPPWSPFPGGYDGEKPPGRYALLHRLHERAFPAIDVSVFAPALFLSLPYSTGQNVWKKFEGRTFDVNLSFLADQKVEEEGADPGVVPKVGPKGGREGGL
jgi:hypothetical protein